MLLLALLAVVAGLFAVAKAPPLARVLAVPIVVALTLVVVLDAPLAVALPVVAVAAVGVVILDRATDWRYVFSNVIPTPMTSTYTVLEGDGSRPERARWVQWRGHVMRHRSAALTC